MIIVLVTHDEGALEKLVGLASSLQELGGPKIRGIFEKRIDRVIRSDRSPVMETELPSVDGGRLETLDDVRSWLGHPKNQRETSLFIVGWDGNIPFISLHAIRELSRDSFCSVVLREQRIRKTRPQIQTLVTNQEQ